MATNTDVRENSIADVLSDLSQESAGLIREELRLMVADLAAQVRPVVARAGSSVSRGLGVGAFGALTAGLIAALGRRPARGALLVATSTEPVPRWRTRRRAPGAGRPAGRRDRPAGRQGDRQGSPSHARVRLAARARAPRREPVAAEQRTAPKRTRGRPGVDSDVCVRPRSPPGRARATRPAPSPRGGQHATIAAAPPPLTPPSARCRRRRPRTPPGSRDPRPPPRQDREQPRGEDPRLDGPAPVLVDRPVRELGVRSRPLP